MEINDNTEHRMKKENNCLDCLKAIACIMVVLNHFHGDGLLGQIIYTISHIGVPIFFLTSGYFLYSAEKDKTLQRLPFKKKHIVTLFLIHMALYGYDFVIQAFEEGRSQEYVIRTLQGSFSPVAFGRSFFWSESLFGTGQWFLIALIQAYVVFWIIYKFRAEGFIIKYSLPVAIILFAIHIPVRFILINSGITGMGLVSIYESAIVRNVWTDGLPFMLIGIHIHYIIAKGSSAIIKKNQSKSLLIIAFSFLIISVLEGIVTKIYYPDVSCVLYIGTIISCASFFSYAIVNPEITNKYLAYIGKNLSMLVYFLHPIVGRYVNGIIIDSDYLLSHIRSILIIIGTVGISFIVYKVNIIIKANCKVKGSEIAGILVSIFSLMLWFLPTNVTPYSLAWGRLSEN
jgi:surface polysaccharide O-acyltransferase-like enzyme